MSDKDSVQVLAEEHVDWFLEVLRPLLIEHFIHGYKHGKEDRPDINIADQMEAFK